MLAVGLAIYEILIRPQVTRKLVIYWARFYAPTRRPAAALPLVGHQLRHLAPYMGFPFAVDAVGVLAGIAALVWLRRFALAALFPIMLVITIAASAAHKYPFGDLRTSTFWLVAVPVLIAVAVAAVGRLATAIDRRMPALVAVVALALWVPPARPYFRVHSLPVADVPSALP